MDRNMEGDGTRQENYDLTAGMGEGYNGREGADAVREGG